MISTEDKAKFETLLKKAGLAYEKLTVFGTIRLNVHVTCVSRETAHKWATLLSTVFPGKKVHLVATQWEAKENKGTCLLKTMRKGFLIGVNS